MEGPRIDLVLLDLDGTLLSLNFNAEKTRANLHDFYFSEYGVDEYFRPVLQKISEVEGIIESKKGTDTAKEATEKALSILKENEREALSGAIILPYANETVFAFKEKDTLTGVFSRTTRSVVLEAIEKFGLGPFDIILAREDTVRTKPSPEPVEFALSNLKIKPGHCLVVGDHPYDIISGKEAGALTAGLLTGLAGKKDLLEAGSDYVFNDLRGLVLEFLGVEMR
jgi:phosphoglycolate phosphatase